MKLGIKERGQDGTYIFNRDRYFASEALEEYLNKIVQR